MHPIHGERGKFYYAIKCANPQCQELLTLAECPTPISDDEGENIQKRLHSLSVRCPICTQETPIEQRRIHVLGVR